MKKLFAILGFLFALFLITNNLEADAYQIQADIKTKRIPAGTKLELEMANSVLSESLSQGDMFSAYLTRDVRTVSTMILPRGTIVRGNVSKVTESKRPYRSAVLYLNFDHVVAPNGQQLPIKAGLCEDFNLTDNGGIKGGGNYGTKVKKNWSKSGAIFVGVSVADLFKKGEDVYIQKGQVFNILLLEALDVPVSE